MSEIFLPLLVVLWARPSNALPITLQSQFIISFFSFFLLKQRVLIDYLIQRWNRCLGIENMKGTLRPGAHADLVVLDKQGVVLSTWIRGKQTWPKGLRP